MRNNIGTMLQSLRDGAPLIHAITNPISICQCANAVLALGARPIMAEHPGEVCQITRSAGALLLNLGNITDIRMESMWNSAHTASQEKIPFVLDAVGVGCSQLRRDYAMKLMASFCPTVIKGNYAEIYALAHPSYSVSGVDGDNRLPLQRVVQSARQLACEQGGVVLASGKADVITDGARVILGKNGTTQLSQITGTGCMLGIICSCFLAVSEPLDGAVAACTILGVAGERAATTQGSGTFFVNLMDQLSILDGDGIHSEQRLEEYTGENDGYNAVFGDR